MAVSCNLLDSVKSLSFVLLSSCSAAAAASDKLNNTHLLLRYFDLGHFCEFWDVDRCDRAITVRSCH